MYSVPKGQKAVKYFSRNYQEFSFPSNGEKERIAEAVASNQLFFNCMCDELPHVLMLWDGLGKYLFFKRLYRYTKSILDMQKMWICQKQIVSMQKQQMLGQRICLFEIRRKNIRKWFKLLIIPFPRNICVKTIYFGYWGGFSEALEMNLKNRRSETPLHSSWSY